MLVAIADEHFRKVEVQDTVEEQCPNLLIISVKTTRPTGPRDYGLNGRFFGGSYFCLTANGNDIYFKTHFPKDKDLLYLRNLIIDLFGHWLLFRLGCQDEFDLVY